jgi:hypothetical protein
MKHERLSEFFLEMDSANFPAKINTSVHRAELWCVGCENENLSQSF